MASTRRIGVSVDFMGAHGRGVFQGIAAYANLAGWELVTNPFWAFGASHVPVIPAGPLDGLIASLHNERTHKKILERHLLTVNISSNREAFCPSVVTDNAAIGHLAFSYLRSLGLNHFAYSPMGQEVWSEQRGAAFLNAAAKEHCQTYRCDPQPADAESHDSPIDAWLKRLPTPVGLFAANDTCALHVLRACDRLGLQVPERVAVLGVDNDQLINSLAAPALSSIDPNAYAVGYRAAQMLDGLLRGDAQPAKPLRISPLKVVGRLSTQNLARADPEVAQAMRFIREHVAKPLNVEDVLQAVPLSRRPLEKRFLRRLGCTILDEIHRAKIERAQRLLVESDLTLAGVARACGFASQTRLNIIFKKLTGDTPGEYRQRNASLAIRLAGHPASE